jgi:hypothetical protein
VSLYYQYFHHNQISFAGKMKPPQLREAQQLAKAWTTDKAK